MYIFYKTEQAQIEIAVPEENFLNIANNDFSNIINLFKSFKSRNIKIYPQTKKEGEWMIYAYCELMKLKQPIPMWLSHYFHISFSKILNGVQVSNALNLVNAPHRPAESYIAERNQSIYSDVSELMNNGMPLYDAALDMAEKYELHESNIQKIYSAIKKTKSKIVDDDINLPF